MIKINCTKKPDSISKIFLSTVTSYISQNRRDRIERFKHREDAYRALIAGMLVRTMACQFLGIQNSDLQFGESKYGKPYLLHYKDFHFNISHSGDWIVCAIDDQPVGIDVEKIDKVDFAIARQVFTKKELEHFSNVSDQKKEDFFFELWTLKESYIKAIGEGFSKEPSTFSISFSSRGPNLDSNRISDPSQKYYFKQYSIDSDYKMAVCSYLDNFPEKLTIFGFRELYDNFMRFAE